MSSAIRIFSSIKSRFAGVLCGLFGCVAVLLLPAGASAQTFYNSLNSGGDVIINANTTVQTGTYSLTSLTVTTGAVLTIAGGSTLNVTGSIAVVQNSAIVLQSINNTAQVNGVWAGQGVTLNAGSVQVDAGSSINADGQGYVASAGPGGIVVVDSVGGSYGGKGGRGDYGTLAAAIYGSDTAPTDLGSGGSNIRGSAVPGAGGGAVRLIVSGTLTNNGIISANGGNETGVDGGGGGGSGGSVYVTTAGLTGTGFFTANGGNDGDSTGGGGRVAVYYNATLSSFSGYSMSTASAGSCAVANGCASGGTGTAAFFDTSSTNDNLMVYQDLTIPAGSTVNYNSITVQTGSVLTIGGGSTVNIAAGLTVGGTVVLQSINNTAQVNGVWVGAGVTLNAASVTVNTGGSINADGQGYVASAGPGGIVVVDSVGGSYGGKGGTGDYGTLAAATYGSATAPTDLGSGGSNIRGSAVPGAGGGAVRLIVSGTLTNNGIISANGGNETGVDGGGGGGSGGSVYVTTAGLTGTGFFTANGGNGGDSGGGGGRVALYYQTNSGFNLASITANAGSAGKAGAAGTVYLLGAGTNLTVSDNTVLPANSTLNYSSITVNHAGALSFGSNSNITAGTISVSAGGTMTVGGGSTMTVSGALMVTGNSNVILQSTNNTAQMNGVWAGQGVTLVAASAEVDAGSSINADGQGYVAGEGPGAAVAGDSGGGSYGGKGGRGDNGALAAATYGSATGPADLGSGGSNLRGAAIPGAGGGAVRLIVSGTLINNGIISANGGNETGYDGAGGGGSGGSVLLVTGTLSGTGSIAASGGNGGDSGGGGGRVAVYYLNNGGFNLAAITAGAGTASNAGTAGTVDTVNGPTTVFLQPTESVIHGTATVQYFTNTGERTTLKLAGPQTATLGTNSGDISTVSFDTTQFPDGSYQLVLSVMNSAGQQVQQVTQSEVINNSVQWHSGTLTSSQTWGPTPVQALDGNVIVPAGVTLTIVPGTVVKVLPGVQIIVQSGGTLIATGTTGLPVTFTTFDDYTVGGDTDFNQGISVPAPGEWSGIDVNGGTFNSNTNTIIRYAEASLSGTLSTNTTLLATVFYTVTGTLVVPSGVTLNIPAGTVLKFASGAGMDVQPGGTLNANGTLAQPIYFTSINDSSIGGTASGSGSGVAAAPGDWNSILLDGATVSLQHVQMQYGGGPLNTGNQAGMIETTDGANVTIADSTFANSYAIGIQTGYPNGGGDTVTVTDSVFYGNEDRAINAYPGSTVHAVNDTFDSNLAGVMAHGGTVDVENSVVSNSLGTQFGGITVCCGGNFTALTNNDVYTTTAGAVNYASVTDPTGTHGNISTAPVYMNGPQHDYRPTYGSPLIDAANATVANYPSTDAFGLARYNAPLVTTKTGTPDANGLYPDIGAFEFAQSAPSNLDFTVSNVSGPPNGTVGTQVTVNWTVTNIGTGTAYGPWHDAVYLVSDPGTNPVAVLAGTVLEGQGVVLGPGASYNASGTITVPGVTVGDHQWEVKTNVLGEVFEGANTGNNTGVALGEVAVDLTQLVAGAAPVNGSFAGAGQSAYYKVVSDGTQTIKVQLALTSGAAGSVQLFIGGGYVPTPQHYDYQQVEFDSTSASVVIPSGAAQTYYVTAYAQTIPVSPAAYTIQASALQFSITSVSPNSVSNNGTATVTFNGGGFTSSTVFSLVAANGTVYSPTATFLSASDQAQVAFSFTAIPTGVYTAQASNGGTVTLANALTVTVGSGPSNIVSATGGGDINVWLELPQAFRAGFPSIVTLHYQNVSGYDRPAPMIYLSATFPATLTEIAPACSGCDPNLALKYGNTFNSGIVMGINQQGPAGVLPAGASGSIQFIATTGLYGNTSYGGNATFNAATSGPGLVAAGWGDIIASCSLNSICPSGYGLEAIPIQFGSYLHGTDFCSSLVPPGSNTAGFTRSCLVLLNKLGFTYAPLPSFVLPFSPLLPGQVVPYEYVAPFIYSSLTFASLNQLLADDATELSASGDYEYDGQKLLAYELQKDGQTAFNRQYHQGAFGFGPSQPFDITLSSTSGAPTINYPDGSTRIFATVSPTQSNVYLGIVGDYATVTLQSDGSSLLTETDGTLYHFPASSSAVTSVDYVQDRNGNKTTFAYAAEGGSIPSLVRVTDYLGRTANYQYDSKGHITQYTDFVGRVTNYTYTYTQSPVGTSPAVTYAFLTSVSNAKGTTSFTWNEGGPSGVGYIDDSCVATYCETPIGIASITYPDGTHTYYTYDAAGRLIGTKGDGGNSAVTYAYNSNGTVIATDALGHSYVTQQNAIGPPMSITDPLGNQLQSRYDAEGKVTSIIGPKGDITSFGYDSSGNPSSLQSATGGMTTFSYGPAKSLQSATDANGNTSTYTYDSKYNLIAASGPDGRQVLRTYDSYGRPLSITNKRGHTTTFAYGSNGKLASKTLASGTTYNYGYDSHDNLTSSSSPAGTTTYSYDSADRLTKVTSPNGTFIQYTYNAGGQHTSTTDSTGHTVNYSYDSAGRVGSVKDGNGNTLATYVYDLNGNIVNKTLGNGTTTTVGLDAAGNVTSVVNKSSSNAVIGQYTYTYDPAGNVSSIGEPSGTMSIGYDDNGQTTSVTTPTSTTNYTYDSAGNRTQVGVNGTSTSVTTNNLDETTSIGVKANQYDADGNCTSCNGVTYTYDDDNHVTSMTDSSGNTTSYTYDGLGGMVSTQSAAGVVAIINDISSGNNQTFSSVAASQTVQNNFVTTGQAVSAGVDLINTVQSGTTNSNNYYSFDGQGNTVQTTNASGTVTGNASYTPLGDQSMTATVLPSPFTYQGESGVTTIGPNTYNTPNGETYNGQLGAAQQAAASVASGTGNGYVYNSASGLLNNQPLDSVGFSFSAVLMLGISVNLHSGDIYFTGGVSTGAGPSVTVSQVNDTTTTGAARAELTDSTLTGLGASAGIGPVGFTATTGDSTTDRTFGDKLGVSGGYTVNLSRAIGNQYTDALGQGYWQLMNFMYGGLLFNDSPQDVLNPNHAPPTRCPGCTTPPPQPCGSCIYGPGHQFVGPVKTAVDPNGKLTSGYGSADFVPAGSPINYTIYFENQATATLPAQKVTVTDPLPSNLDWSTVQFTQVAFNNVTLNAPANSQTYTAMANVTTDPNPVNVSAAINPVTGVMTWTMQSVDPVTGAAPANPLSGFLPANNSANAGSGYVTFSVMPKAGLANGTTITNQASIVFDANAAIATNTVINTLDTSSVTSAISPMSGSTTSTTFNVSWTGSDPTGSGIASYNIYVSIDGGAYSLWLSATTLTSSTYTGAAGHSYTFVSVATNNVGTVQTTTTTPQTMVVNYLTPVVTVTPATSTVLTGQSLVVTIGVAAPSGTIVPTGTVTLTSGTYTSSAATLSNGAALITLPASALSNAVDVLTASYTPDTAGSAFFSAATGSTQVTVGTPALPTGTLTPASLTFTATSGTTSAAQTVQFTNTGSTAINISGVTITGTGAGSFADSSACGNSLPVGYSCNISVTFTPSSVSSFSATLSVSDNVAGSPQTVSLTGTGVAPATFQLSASPALQSVLAGSTASYTISVSPQGGAFTSAVVLTASGLPSGATATFTSASVTPGTTAATSTLSIQTPTSFAMLRPFGGPSIRPILALLGVLFFATRKRRRFLLLNVLFLASFAGLASVVGCGSAPQSISRNYTITVTGTSGPQSQTATVTLTLHN